MQYFLIFESMVKLTMKRFEKDCSENRCFSIFSCGCNHYKSVHIGFAKIQLFPHSTNFYFFFSVFFVIPKFLYQSSFFSFSLPFPRPPPFLRLSAQASPSPVHHRSCAFSRRFPPLVPSPISPPRPMTLSVTFSNPA